MYAVATVFLQALPILSMALAIAVIPLIGDPPNVS